jgi:two-component SAPR family response regulator
LLYYRIQQKQATLKQWMAGLLEELSQGTGKFGENLSSVVKGNKVVAWAEALAADLGAYRKGAVHLFIDEMDRVPFDSDFERFIRALVKALPANVQIIVSSRQLTYEPWHSLLTQGQAVVLGTEKRRDEVMFAPEPKARPQLEVYAFGRGYVLVNGQMITNWDGALPRNLFFYFLDRPLVTRREIFETFWPNLPTKEATNVFHVTKRKISERISLKIDPTKTFELTQYGSGFYTPSEKLTRHYDVTDFQADVERAMITADEAEEENLLQRAVTAYRAPFLQDDDMPWMVERREKLRQLNAQALINLGRIYKRRQEDPKALGFFSRALTQTPEREDIHREVIQIYLRLGMKADARNQYNRLSEILRDQYNIGPSRESIELYNLIED